MKFRTLTAMFALALFALASCAGAPAPAPDSVPDAAATVSAPSSAAADAPSATEPESAATDAATPDTAAVGDAAAEAEEDSAPPELSAYELPELPPAGGILAYYSDNAMAELVSPRGVHVLIDVYAPAFLSREPTEDDILLITHDHSDHYDPAFFESFPGKKVFRTDVGCSSKDVTVTVVPSAHNLGDAISPAKATNYLYLVDLGGFRVAHFGDIGQAPLSAAQLAKLGRVDMLFTQLANGYSGMSEGEDMGFDFIAQVQPRIIVPCHATAVSHERAAGKYAALCTSTAGILVTPAVFGDEPLYVVMGTTGFAMREAGAFPAYEEKFPFLYGK